MHKTISTTYLVLERAQIDLLNELGLHLRLCIQRWQMLRQNATHQRGFIVRGPVQSEQRGATHVQLLIGQQREEVGHYWRDGGVNGRGLLVNGELEGTNERAAGLGRSAGETRVQLGHEALRVGKRQLAKALTNTGEIVRGDYCNAQYA